MFHKMLGLTIIVSLLVGIALLIPGRTGQTLTQEEIPPKDTSCINCHEDQYYLYDSGNWYCLNETKVGCTECHRGRPDTRVKESAHAGLIANPLVNDAAVCQNCHPDDYRARVQTYASIAGISPTPRPYATYVPSTPISQSGESAGGMRLLRSLPPGAWQVAGLSFFGVAFLILFLFACRCWKTDRGVRSKSGRKVESDSYVVS
jgi:cytochrome c553